VVVARRPPRRGVAVLIGAVFIVLVAAGTLARFYTDLLWFDEVGKSSVFWGRIVAQVTLGVAAGIGTALVIGVNLAIVDRVSPRYRLAPAQRATPAEQYRAVLGPYLRPLRLLIAAFLGLVIGLQTAGLWDTYLLWRNRVSFGERDPQFGRDIGFYVFELPFQRAVFGWLFATLILATLLVAVAHYLLGGIRPQAEGNRVAAPVIMHLSVLIGLLVLLKAWAYRLDQFDLLYSPRGTVTGASYTDVKAQLPALQFLVIAAIACAALFFYNVRQRGYVLPAAGLVVLVLVSVLVGFVYPQIVQRFQVDPQELQREEPYIQRNIEATRRAFKLDDVRPSEFQAEPNLTRTDLRDNRSTIDNIRVWEAGVLKQATTNLQAIGQYYDFNDVDVDRYQIDGQLRQVMVSAREVDPTRLQSAAQTWQNVHLAYTHGYGVVAAQVNTAQAPGGQPVYVVSNFSDLDKAKIPVTQPRIYFGELLQGAPAFTIGNSRQPEVGAPSAGSQQGAANFHYDGNGGVQLSSPLRRLAFALRFRDVNLLISGNISGRSRLMFNRDVRDRVEKVAPFLQWDGDPYVAVVDGRIVFIRDGYTTTAQYPYSERIRLEQAARRTAVGERGVRGVANYIRNSVKAVVDAYDGTVTLYAYDESDPLLRAWRKTFPNLFAPRDQISGALRAHLRYPEDMFSVQAERYKSYHIVGARDFYSKQDFWDLPEDRSGEVRQQQNSLVSSAASERARPYYLLSTLPGEEQEGFVLVQTFTPNGKPNMVAYLAARADPDPQGPGGIISYSLPRARQIAGPAQVVAQMLADPNVSQEITFFNQQGSRVTLGNLLVVPVEESLLYVQPLFVQATNAAIPELRRVMVFFNGQLGYEPTLSGAIDEVLGPGGAEEPTTPGGSAPPPTTATPSGGEVRQLLDQAGRALETAQQALQRGDLGAYQRGVNSARDLIRQAQSVAARQPQAEAGTPPG
jgi:uncharacterized membrane protein (UPF0182 family)